MEHILLYAIVPVVVVMLAGYISGRKGVFSGADAAKFNKVVLDFALPAALFVSIVSASREMLMQDIKLTVISVVAIMGVFILVYFLYGYCFRGNTPADGAIAALINGSPTIGFLGFAVLEPIFGTSPRVALVVAIVGIVVNAIGIPVGLTLLNRARASSDSGTLTGPRPSAWRPVVHALRQPVAWAPILAVVMVLCGIRWPAWLSPSFDLIAKANASMAVFAAGITLSAVRVTLDRQAVSGSVIKLIVQPALALALGLLFHMDPMNLKMLVVACALPPAFSGIIIASRYDTYVATGTSSLALSVLLFTGFCPLWIWITDMAVKVF